MEESKKVELRRYFVKYAEKLDPYKSEVIVEEFIMAYDAADAIALAKMKVFCGMYFVGYRRLEGVWCSP